MTPTTQSVVVPVEPTPEMIEAAKAAASFYVQTYEDGQTPVEPVSAITYRAMLAAAPAAPQAAGVGELVVAEEIMATLAEEVPALDGYDEGELAALEASVASTIRSHFRAPDALRVAVEAFMPSAEVAFLWSKETPPAEEVRRYRERYWAVKEALAAMQAEQGAR